MGIFFNGSRNNALSYFMVACGFIANEGFLSIIDEAAEKSHYVHKIEGNIHELIKRCAGLFVINSGTGFEAILHGKPVVTFGDCDYKQVTFNGDLVRLNEARNFIYSYKEEFRALAYKFIWWYWNCHAYDVTMDSTKTRLTDYLRGVL